MKGGGWMIGQLFVRRVAAAGFACFMCSCSLFEPREPEQPSQSALDFVPPTEPRVVISNLQNSIAQKNTANYIRCFSDPATSTLSFSFIPSEDGRVLLQNWTFADEQLYFQNLVARGKNPGYSNLVLTQKSSLVTADSVVYNYDYIFTFENSIPELQSPARGNLQFTLGHDNTNSWMIYRWIDAKSTTDASWSLFKVRFGR